MATKKTTKKSTPTTTKTKPQSKKPTPAQKSETSISGAIIGAIIAAIVIIAIVIIATVLVDKVVKSNRTGTYEISRVTENGEEKADSLSLLKALGLKGTITFKEDKTCRYDVLGTSYDCTYTDTEIISDEDGSALPYTFDNQTIVITKDANTLTFSRASDK